MDIVTEIVKISFSKGFNIYGSYFSKTNFFEHLNILNI